MGEFALYRGNRIKIGTCEDMYYLRFDQRNRVTAQSGNVDPVRDAAELRFRFPWPDEDDIPPGSDKFHDRGFHRSLVIRGFEVPAGVEHGSVQFVAQAGYLVSLPCPEDKGAQLVTDAGAPLLTIHRNGFAGAVSLVGQRYRPWIGLVPILKCGGCGCMYRSEGVDEIEALAVAIRSMADREGQFQAGPRLDAKLAAKPDPFLMTVADRLLAGLGVTP